MKDSWKLGLAWALLSALYLWMQRSALSILPGDEAIYLLDGRLFADGVQPYRDFFLAHPPLRVLSAGMVFAAGGGAVAVKALDLFLMAAAAGLAGLAVWPSRGWRWAALAVFFCLFSTLGLELGGVFMGQGLALPLLAGSLLAATRGRHLLAGVLVGIAGLQATYALMPAPVLAWWAFRDRRLARFAAGAAVFPAGLGAGWLAWGDAFLDQVLLYHVAKVGSGHAAFRLGRIANFVNTEAGLLAFSLAAVIDRTGVGRRAAAAGWLCVVVASLYQALFAHYFVIAVPFLAVASVAGLAAVGERVAVRSTTVRRAAAGLLAAVLLVTHAPHVLYGLALHDQRVLQARDADRVTQAILAHRPSSGLVWGDSALVPLIALQTDLRVALDMADTNDQRFTSGRTDPGEVIAALAKLPAPGVLLLEEHGVWLIPELRQWVQANLVEVFTLSLPALGHVCRYYVGPGDAEAIRRRVQAGL